MGFRFRGLNWPRLAGLVIGVAVLAAACGAAAAEPADPGASFRGFVFPDAPEVPSGPLPEGAAIEVSRLHNAFKAAELEERLGRLGESGDARLAWVIADFAWFNPHPRLNDAAVAAFNELTGTDVEDDPTAQPLAAPAMLDHLIAWDLPAPPDFVDLKRIPFDQLSDGWAPFFNDDNAAIDWRLLSWGGVLIDDRPLGDPAPCPTSCIPALDDPGVADAAGGDWFPDHRVVFGVVVNSEARTYPRNILEVHEMVNDTIGGRRIGLPYCTLCGSAQAYFLDDLPEPVLRTSGLLIRSNKLMFDLSAFSAIDTFTGEALSGPLHDAGINLTPVAVVTSTWGDWKAEHPNTTIVAEDGGIGRVYPDNPLEGRDSLGPIFPIGDVDPRLDVQAPVLGVIASDGTPVAFPVEDAAAAFAAGQPVELGGVTIVAAGSGLRATADGEEIASNQAFWFAWSQFHEDTLLWVGADPTDS